MKLLVFLALVICASAIPADIEDYKKKAEEHIQICKGEAKVSQETADKLKQGDFSDSSDGAKCFVECFFKRTGFLNENGEPQADIMLAKLANKPEARLVSSESLKTLVNKCIKETGANNCEKAFNIYKCYKEGITEAKA